MGKPFTDDDLAGWPQVIAYNLDGTVDKITITAETLLGVEITYEKNFTWDDGNLIGVSEWARV